jgi:phage terminase large subunit-like protein
MGAWRARCKLNDETPDRKGNPQGLVQRIHRTATLFGVDRIIIENKTRGVDVTNELHRQFADRAYHIQMFEPGKHGDKVARLHSVQPLFSQRLVYAPGLAELAYNNHGQEYVRIGEFQWVKDVMNEVQTVPRGQHDDYSDALSQGLITLREEGFLQLTREYIAQQMAIRTFHRQPRRVAQSYGVG